jgi:glycosyltransferase involved in cell wall biosynthesis
MSIRIIHIITTIERGGAESQLLMLATKQALEGKHVEVFYLKGLPSLYENFQTANVKVIPVLTDRPFVYQILLLRRYLKTIRGTYIIHAHLPQSELLATIAKTSKGKLINSRHFGGQFFPQANHRVSSFLGRMATCRSSHVVAISESVAKILIANREVTKTVPIKTIYYGFDFEGFRTKKSITKPFTLGKGINIGTVARLSPEKDLETLLRAFKIVSQSGWNTNLYIVGSGRMEDELKSIATSLNISHSVIFLGKISEVLEFMEEIDIFVLTSKFEGFGMVLLEAMAANTRVIAANNSAMVEVIGDDGAACFFETGNEIDLANQINIIKDRSKESFRSAQQGRLNYFSISKAERCLHELYEAALSLD